MRSEQDFLRQYFESMMSPAERLMVGSNRKPEDYVPLEPIPPFDLFVGEKRYNSRTVPLRTLFSHALGSTGSDDYRFIDNLFGVKVPDANMRGIGTGISTILQKLIIDQEANITIGGSIVADCIGTTHEHMVKNSKFLARMQWIFGREIKPELFTSDPKEMFPHYPKALSHHLIRLYYAGGLNVDAMSDNAYTLFRFLQKLAGANADLRIVSKTTRDLGVIRDLLAANLSILYPYQEASLSTVSYGNTNLIHVDNPYAMGKDINIIVGDKPDDPYSNITTWRQAATGVVYHGKDNSLVVDIDPEKFKQANKMLYTPKDYWAWLTYAYKNARSILVAGVPTVVFDQRTFKAHEPPFNPHPSHEQVINATANAVHADAINSGGLNDIVESLRISNRRGLNDYDEVYRFIMEGLSEIFVGPPHEDIMPFIEDLARSMTTYLPVRLPRLIERTPPSGSRDKVEARILGIDLDKRRGMTTASFAIETINRLLADPIAASLSADELASIEQDKSRLAWNN